MRHRDAVDRARIDRVGQPPDRKIERGVPGQPKTLRIEVAAQAVGGLTGHADRLARLGDAPRFGERGNEGVLSLGRPAVVPIADGHGVEIDRRGGGIAHVHGATCNPYGSICQDGASFDFEQYMCVRNFGSLQSTIARKLDERI